jgi:hypothetical protein
VRMDEAATVGASFKRPEGYEAREGGVSASMPDYGGAAPSQPGAQQVRKRARRTHRSRHRRVHRRLHRTLQQRQGMAASTEAQR